MNTSLNPKRRFKKAFTLVEILIVIMIIAILAAVTSKVANSVTQSQARARAVADLAAIGTGLEAFKSMYNDYPRLNAKSDGVTCSRDLYKCLMGKTFMRLTGNQITLVDLERSRDFKPLLDIAIMRIGDPKNPESDAPVDYDSPVMALLDPWGNPYMYYYDSSTMAGSVGAWESAAFILMSNGPDGEAIDVQSMYSNGIMPDENDYRNDAKNVDNLIYGREN